MGLFRKKEGGLESSVSDIKSIEKSKIGIGRKILYTFAAAVLFVNVQTSYASANALDDDSVIIDDDTYLDDSADDTEPEFAADFEFSAPETLETSTDYDFKFTVANRTNPEIRRWISGLEMFLPTVDYRLYDDQLMAPETLHDGEWSVEKITDQVENGTFSGIRWMYQGMSTSESYGDIREGESLDFAFRAKTDSFATDGFEWQMKSLDGENPPNEFFLQGISYIHPPGDDDATDDDTAGDIGNGSDDGSSSGGCGC